MTRCRTLAAGLAGAGALLVLVPAAASASTVHYDGAGVLQFAAAPGETNNLGVQAAPMPDAVWLYDSAVAVTQMPAACADQGYFVECPAPAGVHAELGDGDDWSYVSFGVTVPVSLAGGAGADMLDGSELPERIDGGPGDDRIQAGAGDDIVDAGDGADQVQGAEGADRIAGGPGDDLLRPDGYETPSADVVDGGPGFDRIESDWGSRDPNAPKLPLSITLGGGADDGRPGEGDDLRGIEAIDVNAGGRFVGTDADERIRMWQVGEPGEIVAGGGADSVLGGEGRDRIDGGAGDDTLDGGFGDDRIDAGPGSDVVSADKAGGDCGPIWCRLPWGNDVVEVRDGETDSVSCGAGSDRVLADAADIVAPDCEVVDRSAAVTPSVRLAGAPPRLADALRAGLVVRVAGWAEGVVAVRARHGGKRVARGRAVVGETGTAVARVKFSRAARQALGGRRSARLTLVAGEVRARVTLRR